MSKTTRATQALDRAGISYSVHSYAYDPNAESIGLQAAESLGVEPQIVLKTLMAQVDGKPVCVVVPSDREVSMKRLAAAFAGKQAQMMRPTDAERLTGYRVGGISPFGQKKAVPTVIEAAALAHESVFVNGGQRGLQVRLRPADARDVLRAKAVALVSDA
jgi:Cys-tRNA(Pro)/Cys-tRNA(Cys) deacylase